MVIFRALGLNAGTPELCLGRRRLWADQRPVAYRLEMLDRKSVV